MTKSFRFIEVVRVAPQAVRAQESQPYFRSGLILPEDG